MTFQHLDLIDLKTAKTLLENPGLAAKITNFIGTPIEKGFGYLPANWTLKVGEITRAVLSKAINIAVFTMKDASNEKASNTWHKLAVAASVGIQVSEKVAAQAIPVIGAAGGAIINMIFIDHFQDMARGHFIVRRLERKYGTEIVRATYRTI